MAAVTKRRANKAGLVFDLVLFSVALAGFLWLGTDLRYQDVTVAGHLGTIAGIVVLWRIAVRPPYGFYSVPSLYVIVFCLFHFGLTSSLAMGAQPNLDTYWDSVVRWVHKPTVEAMRMSIIGVFGIGLGTTLADLVGNRHDHRPTTDGQVDALFGLMGSALLSLGVGAWIVIQLLWGGAGVFMDSYMNMLEATADSPIIYAYYSIGFSVPLLVSSRFRYTHIPGIVSGALFVILAFPMGVRGPVLLPSIVTLAILIRRKVIAIRPAVLIIMAITLLSISSVVRDIRAEGLSRADTIAFSTSPVKGLMELGSSLYPVTAVIDWADSGEEYIYGASYWAPLERAITKFIPYTERLPAVEDERLMNVLVLNRGLGPVGFSVVAEAYRNFGPLGVASLLTLLGFVLGRINLWPNDAAWNALLGVIFLALLGHVRNSFVPVPLKIVGGTSFIVLAFVIARLQGNRSPSRVQPALALRQTPLEPRDSS